MCLFTSRPFLDVTKSGLLSLLFVCPILTPVSTRALNPDTFTAQLVPCETRTISGQQLPKLITDAGLLSQVVALLCFDLVFLQLCGGTTHTLRREVNTR